MPLPADTNWFHCQDFLKIASTTLGTLMNTFAKNKTALGFQHLFFPWDSALQCGPWCPTGQITAAK